MRARQWARVGAVMVAALAANACGGGGDPGSSINYESVSSTPSGSSEVEGTAEEGQISQSQDTDAPGSSASVLDESCPPVRLYGLMYFDGSYDSEKQACDWSNSALNMGLRCPIAPGACIRCQSEWYWESCSEIRNPDGSCRGEMRRRSSCYSFGNTNDLEIIAAE